MADNKFAKYKAENKAGNKFEKYRKKPEPESGGDKVAPYGLSGLVTGQKEQPASGWSMDDIISFKRTSPGEAFKKLDDTVRMFSSGVTFGFGDKAAAGVDAVVGQGDYTSNLSDNRAMTEKARQNTGATGTIAEIGGSMVPATKLAQLGLTATRLPGMIGKYLGLTADGAALGALNSYGNDQDVTQGAAYGAVGGGLGQMVGAGASKIADMFASAKYSPVELASSKINQAVASMKGSPGQVQTEIQRLGPDAMLIDALGERGGAMGRYSANINPDARELLEGALMGRKALQNQRVVTDLENVSGLPVGNTKTPDALKKEAYDAVAPQINRAYEAAREAGFDASMSGLDDILQTPMGSQAKNQGLTAVRNRFFDAPQPNPAGVLPAGAPVPPSPVKPNYAQANRAVNELVPSMGKRPAKPADILDFVIAKGGVRDTGGELRSFDFSKTRKGQLATRVNAGRDMDEMRELAAEAGYFDHLYGNPRDAVAKSTTADLIDALGETHAGRPVFSGGNAGDVADWQAFKDYQRTRADFRHTGKQVAEKLPERLSDDAVRDLISRVDRGENLDDAIEAVRYSDFMENGAAPREVPAGLGGEKVRNFSNLALLDETKKALDDMTSSAYRAGENNKGSQAAELARALRDRVDALVPEYGGARKLRQDAYRTEDAFDLGQTLAKGRVPLDAANKVAAVDPENLSAVQKAFGSQMSERLLNKNNTEGALAMLETPAGKDIVKAIYGQKADDLANALSREKVFNRSTRAVVGNSTTARQLAEMLGGGAAGGLGAIATGQDLLTGGLAGATIGLTRRVGQAAVQKFASGRSKAMAPELAKLLTQKVLPQGPAQTKAQKAIEANRDLIARLLMGGAILNAPQ